VKKYKAKHKWVFKWTKTHSAPKIGAQVEIVPRDLTSDEVCFEGVPMNKMVKTVESATSLKMTTVNSNVFEIYPKRSALVRDFKHFFKEICG